MLDPMTGGFLVKNSATAFIALALSCACAKKPAESANDARPPEPTSASGEGAPAPAAEGASPDFDTLMAREATGLAPTELQGPNGAFTARASSAGAVQSAVTEGIAVVEIPIGSQAPVRCQVFAEDVDPGGTFAGLFTAARTKVEFQRMVPTSVKVVAGAPAAFVRAVYVTAGPRGKALGELKAMFVAAPGHSLLCFHDEVGYEKTFFKVATEFGESIQHKGETRPAPQLLEVGQATIQDVPVGYSRNLTLKDKGKLSHVVTAFIMAPVSEKELRFGDYVEVHELDAAGRVKNGVWAVATNGQLELNVKVEQVKGGEYKYTGESKGKPLSGTFTTKDKKPLAGYLPTARALAPHAKDKKPFSLESLEYNPDVDPTQPTTVRYYRKDGDEAGSVRVTRPNGEKTGVLDQHGLIEKAKMPAGPTTMDLARLLVQGKP